MRPFEAAVLCRVIVALGQVLRDVCSLSPTSALLFIDRGVVAPAGSPAALAAYNKCLELFDKWEARRHARYGGKGIPYFGLNPRYLHDADEKPVSTAMDKGDNGHNTRACGTLQRFFTGHT